MQVLLSCVGTRDPYWKEEINEDGKRHRILFSELKNDEFGTKKGPLLSLISSMESPPDKVYLFSTAEGKDVRTPTQRGGEKTAQLLEERNIHAIHWPLHGVNPILFESLVPEFTKALQKILEENVDATYSVNVASGTPQMQAVWYVLVNTGLLKAQLLRAVDDEMHEVDIDPLFESEIKDLACTVLESFSFDVAADLLSGTKGLASRTRFAERRQRAELFGGLCRVYAAWTVFDYNLAYDRLKRTSKQYESYLRSEALASIAGQIKDQQRMLAELVKSTISPMIKAIDIFHNAWVHYEMRHYADAVWRASTACELATVGRAMRCLQKLSSYTFKPNKFRRSVYTAERNAQPGSDCASVCDMLRNIYAPKQIPLFLAGRSAMHLLREIDGRASSLSNANTISFDRIEGIRFEKELEERIQKLFDLRNGLVHELQSIKQQDAKTALEVAIGAIKAEFGKTVQAKLEEHPFSFEAFRAFANEVRHLL